MMRSEYEIRADERMSIRLDLEVAYAAAKKLGREITYDIADGIIRDRDASKREKINQIAEFHLDVDGASPNELHIAQKLNQIISELNSLNLRLVEKRI